MTNTMLTIWVVGMLLSLAVMYLMLRLWYTPEDEEVNNSTSTVE